MKILDRYIIKNFLATFFFILGIIIVLAVIIDLVEKMDDFVKMTASFKDVVFDYYLNFILFYMNMFAGLITFIAVIFFTSRLAQRTEIVAMLSGAVSFRRLCFPYFIGATIIASLSLVINHFVLPDANKTRLEFEEIHIRNNAFNVKGKNLHRQIEPGTIAYFESYSHSRNMGYRFSLEHWAGDSLQFKLMADNAHYDTLTGAWRIEDYFVREFNELGSTVRTGNVMDTVINLDPGDLGQRTTFATSMGYAELNEAIAEKQEQGSDQVKHFLIEKHQRSATPFATYIFTLIGVSLASRKTRGGTGMHIFLGLLLTFIFIFALRMAAVGATNAGLSPLLAVWLPNLAFLLVGIWIYRRAPK